MARFSRIHTLTKMEEVGIIPVFYHEDIEIAKGITDACAEAGANVIEFTNRGDFAYEVFGALEKYAKSTHPDVILGVGSIVDPYTAALYIANGTNFVVGPTLNKEVGKLCNRRMLPYAPGCGSATEIQEAQELGCDIVKVFPGEQVGGPAFAKGVKGPMPWTKIMPTGGVSPTKESLTAWFSAGISCAGMGSKLITKEFVAKKDFKGLAASIKETLALVKDVRASL